MIQRIQSLLLLISAFALSVCLFTPVWTASSNGTNYMLDSYKLSVVHENIATEKLLIYTGLLIVASIALTIFIILKFNNRTLQMRLNMMNTLLICMIEGLFFWHIRDIKLLLLGTENFSEHFGIAFYMPLVALMLSFYAGKRIQKDDKLVKSVDRIR